MKSLRQSLLILTLLSLFGWTQAAYADEQEDFSRWLQTVAAKASQEGIKQQVIVDALSDLQLDESVIELDRKQPENKITLEKYLANTVNKRRIKQGRALMVEYSAVLKKVSAQYGVPPQYLVALWGIESDYGAMKGNYAVIQSLATLAYEGRRREFFTNELIASIKIIQQEKIAPYDLVGSWAGAMGDCQFMPSTYLKYAADGNQDGHRDIWNNPADVFASTANYLHDLGWKPGIGWGQRVDTASDFSERDADITRAQTLNFWLKRGIQPGDVDSLGQPGEPLYAIYPGTPEEGLYLITDNYKALLQWNRSRYFATAVGKLADAIAGE